MCNYSILICHKTSSGITTNVDAHLGVENLLIKEKSVQPDYRYIYINNIIKLFITGNFFFKTAQINVLVDRSFCLYMSESLIALKKCYKIEVGKYPIMLNCKYQSQ